jgi:uncharacterized protein YecT (DUF1311 family)
MRIPLLISFLSLCTSLFAQDTTDASRLRGMVYMDIADKVDCDSQEGSNLETRVCLNLEFQKEDSVLNASLVVKLESLPDSLRTALKEEHALWVLERRRLSEEASAGFSGHMLGIIYLQTMIELTRKRLDELEDQKYDD